MNIKTTFDNLDKNKYDTLQHGYAFDYVLIDRDGTPYHTGIGTSEQMSLMSLISICDLYKYGASGQVSIEDFAESVKQGIIHFYHEHSELMQPIGSGRN